MKSIYRKYLTTVALIWAGCFVLFLVVFILVLSPQRKCEKQITKQLAEKKQVYESALGASKEKTKAQYNELLERLRNELRSFAVDLENSAGLTFEVSQIAKEKEVGAFSIKGKDNRGGSELPDCKYICEDYLNISFTGSFNQFATFLNALERHQPVVFIDGFSIERSEENKSGHKVSMNLAVFAKKRQGG